MDERTDALLTKILDVLDKIRINTDMLLQIAKGAKMPIIKRDPEVDRLTNRPKTLGPDDVRHRNDL